MVLKLYSYFRLFFLNDEIWQDIIEEGCSIPGVKSPEPYGLPIGDSPIVDESVIVKSEIFHNSMMSIGYTNRQVIVDGPLAVTLYP